MSQVAAQMKLATGMSSGGDVEVLRTIAFEGTAVSVWHRMPDRAFQAWIDGLASEQLPVLRTLVAVGAVENAVQAACASVALPEGPMRETLAADVTFLARLFADTLGQPFLRLSLDVVHDGAARQFVIPLERARLFSSYRGRGVQFGAAHPNRPPEEILELPTRSVGLFRGLLWPDAEPPGIVHRMPSVDRAGEPALLLVIAPVDAVAGH